MLHKQPFMDDDLPPGAFEAASEFQFLEAVRSIIRACGGNRKVAQGVAIELVKQETDRESR